MASESSYHLPFNTLIHTIIIELSSSNYLLWKSQLLPLLESKDMRGYVDGTMVPPPCFEPKTSSTLNPKYLAWKATDQRLLYLLLSSPTEQAIVVVVGLFTACDVWLALETKFSHHSKAHELRLKDDLQLMKRGTKPVAEYARAYKKKFVTNFMPPANSSRTVRKCTGSFVDSTPIFQFFQLLRWLSPLSRVLQI